MSQSEFQAYASACHQNYNAGYKTGRGDGFALGAIAGTLIVCVMATALAWLI